MRQSVLNKLSEKIIFWINKFIPILGEVDAKAKENQKKLKETKKAIEKLIKEIDKKLSKIK